MAEYEAIVSNASESLLGDERLRSNLTDEEARIAIDWALGWLEKRICSARNEGDAKVIAQSELKRLRAFLAAINGVAAQPQAWSLSNTLSKTQAAIEGEKPFSRTEVFSLLFTLVEAAWQRRSG